MLPKLALDTNAYRALDDGNQQLATLVRTTSQLGLPMTVLGELYYGIFSSERQVENHARLQRFLAVPRLEVLQITDLTARIFGEIASELRQKGRSIQQNDIWIAAICKQYDYSLASADRGFTAVTGLNVVTF